jgi:GT2 family glycosyltransferase
MSSQARISVIIPYYNEGNLLLQALDSIAAQTFAGALEIIVVDDGSEGLPQVPAQYRWPLQFVTRQKNAGAAATRNLGVRYAHADLIAFLDADDVYLPERIQSHVDFLERHPEVVLVGGPHYVERDGVWLHIPQAVSACFPSPLGHRCMMPTASMVLPAKVRVDACLSYFVHSGMMTIRRAAFEQVKGFAEDLRWGEEWDLGVRLTQIGKIGFVPTPGMRYLCRPGTITSTLNAEKEVSAARIFRSWRRTIPELPWRCRWTLRQWERDSLLLAAQAYWEDRRQAPLALSCAWSALCRSPSVWACRSVVRMTLNSVATGARRLFRKLRYGQHPPAANPIDETNAPGTHASRDTPLIPL